MQDLVVGASGDAGRSGDRRLLGMQGSITT
jgi:hypothetical protein